LAVTDVRIDGDAVVPTRHCRGHVNSSDTRRFAARPGVRPTRSDRGPVVPLGCVGPIGRVVRLPAILPHKAGQATVRTFGVTDTAPAVGRKSQTGIARFPNPRD
jgi:hypothetical protein